jgi:hypothetical protein
LLRSGAWRPLWLCDVALLVESRDSDFSWQRCLGSDPLYADWVTCTIGLAHQLLGAEVRDTPVADRAQHLPRWLVPAVLRHWGRARTEGSERWAVGNEESTDYTDSAAKTVHGPFANFSHAYPDNLRNLRTGFADLYARWDNPVRATAAVHGRFNNWPRLPYRVLESILRGPELPRQLLRVWRRGWRPNRKGRDAKGKDSLLVREARI